MNCGISDQIYRGNIPKNAFLIDSLALTALEKKTLGKLILNSKCIAEMKSRRIYSLTKK